MILLRQQTAFCFRSIVCDMQIGSQPWGAPNSTGNGFAYTWSGPMLDAGAALPLDLDRSYASVLGNNYIVDAWWTIGSERITLTPNDTVLFTDVPEPATWAMALIGIGLMAQRLRSRRRAQTVLS